MSNAGKQHDWYFILNNRIIQELKLREINIPKQSCLLVDDSPSKLKAYYRISRLILNYEKKINPDLVYSVGSPSYIYFSAPEVQRLTNPWVTHPNVWAFFTLSFLQMIKEIIRVLIQRFFVSRSQFFITQSNDAKYGILKLTKIQDWKVHVVSNTLSNVFIGQSRSQIKVDRSYIFCLAAPYRHKNIHLLPKIASLLKRQMNKDFCFVITIPYGHQLDIEIKALAKKFNVEDCIINIGPITQDECINWYRKSVAVFLPTYLETFSVTLLEAIYFGLPIVTTDFSFNTDILNDSGLYFKPGCLDEAISQLLIAIGKGNSRNPNDLISEKDYKLHYGEYSDSFFQTIDFFNKVLKYNFNVNKIIN